MIYMEDKMNIKPFNRYLLVSPIEDEQDEDNLSIILPSEYKKPENPHVLCKVKDVSEQSCFYNQIASGDVIVAERRMLNKIEFSGKSAYLVLENYIYGRINNEIDKKGT